MQRGKRTRGLSLAEIVIVMGIVAVLVAVGIPFYIRWRSNQELRSAGERLLSAVRLTQTLATRFAHTPSPFQVPLAGGGWAPGGCRRRGSRPCGAV